MLLLPQGTSFCTYLIQQLYSFTCVAMCKIKLTSQSTDHRTLFWKEADNKYVIMTHGITVVDCRGQTGQPIYNLNLLVVFMSNKFILNNLLLSCTLQLLIKHGLLFEACNIKYCNAESKWSFKNDRKQFWCSDEEQNGSFL